MKTIGRHLIVELYRCRQDLLNDVGVVRAHMLEAARVCGATVMGESFHAFSPQGVSGTVVISESHLSIHTWPENGYVSIDVYTCGGLDPHPSFDYLATAFEADAARHQEILRGLPEELDEHGLLLPDDVQTITRTGRVVDLRAGRTLEPSSV